MLIASYEVTVNKGQRVRVPAEVRRAIGADACVVRPFTSPEVVFEYWPTSGYMGMIDQLLRGHRDPLRRQIERFLLSAAYDQELGARGDLRLPGNLLDQQGCYDGAGRLVFLYVGGRVVAVNEARWRTLRDLRAGESVVEAYAAIGRLPAPRQGVLGDAGAGRSPASEEVADAALRFIFGASSSFRSSLSQGRLFEFETAGLLAGTKCGVVEVTRASHDRGIDLLVHWGEPPANRLLYVQCKSGTRKVTVTDIRELIGCVARDGATAGLLMTSSGWTDLAAEEARTSKLPVDVVAASTLAKWAGSTPLSMAPPLADQLERP